MRLNFGDNSAEMKVVGAEELPLWHSAAWQLSYLFEQAGLPGIKLIAIPIASTEGSKQLLGLCVDNRIGMSFEQQRGVWSGVERFVDHARREANSELAD